MDKSTLITIDSLPNEVLLMIFDNISVYDLLNCSLVAKAWCGLVDRTDRLRLILTTGSLSSFPVLRRSYRNLRIENITDQQQLTINYTPALQTMLENCQNLVCECIEMKEVLMNFLKRCKNLQSLILNFSVSYIPTAKNLSVLGEFPQLREVCLDGKAEVVFQAMPTMPEMRKLWLYGVKIDNQSLLNFINSTPNLELLELQDKWDLTPAAFMSGGGLGALLRLHTLSLPAYVINDCVIAKMLLPRLKKLCIYNLKHLQASTTAITETLAKQCPMLNVINGSCNSVRFKLNPETGKFDPHNDCDESCSDEDPEDAYEREYVIGLNHRFDDDDYDDDYSDNNFDDDDFY